MKWTKNPGKITLDVIEQAYKDGKLTDDRYNLIQLAAGLRNGLRKNGMKRKKRKSYRSVYGRYIC